MGTQGVRFDKPKSEICEAIKKHRGRLTKVAKQFGVCYQTIRSYTDNDPELVELISYLRKDYDENLCDLAEDTLTDAMDNRIEDMSNALKSAFFVLNNKAKERGYNHPDSQNSGPKMTPEQVMQLVNESK
jgi:hypothetical protein